MSLLRHLGCLPWHDKPYQCLLQESQGQHGVDVGAVPRLCPAQAAGGGPVERPLRLFHIAQPARAVGDDVLQELDVT